MPYSTPEDYQSLVEAWGTKIAQANQRNIFCHCAQCQAEWVSSGEEQPCPTCGSHQIERISCWQFPDD
ncbi:MAG: hydrogenase maturation nickel metallochaperone HypA [Oscillatoriales cyanobacterium RM2_1_1]|nr:hydrogenase maturation nickel metallochaperone HypA [Oscillatoriales cyanobacterium SM2_3_0]NJO47973.1 hydrogenase maturation nickel metallochaperone HypA [Oscillatoriales cyanobacterium RM2_1_1]